MKPERRKQYIRGWKKISFEFRQSRNFTCEHCGVVGGRDERVSRRTGAIYTVHTHAAHKNHDPGNPNPELLCLCPSCHGKYDYQHLRRNDTLKSEQLKHKLLLTRRWYFMRTSERKKPVRSFADVADRTTPPSSDVVYSQLSFEGLETIERKEVTIENLEVSKLPQVKKVEDRIEWSCAVSYSRDL
jgi:hypothetical protein